MDCLGDDFTDAAWFNSGFTLTRQFMELVNLHVFLREVGPRIPRLMEIWTLFPRAPCIWHSCVSLRWQLEEFLHFLREGELGVGGDFRKMLRFQRFASSDNWYKLRQPTVAFGRISRFSYVKVDSGS